MPRYRDTGWPTISNVVSTTQGNMVILPAPGLGKAYVLLGVSCNGTIELREDTNVGTLLVNASSTNSGTTFPAPILCGENKAIYLNNTYATSLWYYVTDA
mgnify:CR=1 FL=1|tara:strand:- start:605 stop:904 length:300 start_codon:yes stop_codon:yes gene_type:complete